MNKLMSTLLLLGFNIYTCIIVQWTNSWLCTYIVQHNDCVQPLYKIQSQKPDWYIFEIKLPNINMSIFQSEIPSIKSQGQGILTILCVGTYMNTKSPTLVIMSIFPATGIMFFLWIWLQGSPKEYFNNGSNLRQTVLMQSLSQTYVVDIVHCKLVNYELCIVMTSYILWRLMFWRHGYLQLE